MKTVRLTMAQALIRFLENQYIRFDEEEHRFVRGIFMLPGHGNVVGLGQALDCELRSLEVYQGKNEQGQAHAAIAFAKQMLRRRIFACTSSVGPGAANMVTAAATATANNIPLLLLPGDVYAGRQPDPVLQQIEQIHDLGVSTNDAFKPVCRYFDRINRPEQLMTALISAMRVLTDPADTGAVCIALPQDVQGEAYDYPEHFFEKRVHRIERRPPAAYAVEEATRAITAAKKPLIICGGGVRYSGANEALKSLAEQCNIPFCETQAGKSAVVWNHPLNLGGVGVTGCAAANRVAREADLIIGVGTRYTDFTTASKWLFSENARYVNINVSEFQAYKLDAVRLIADAREALAALSRSLAAENYRSAYTGEIREAKKDWETELARLDSITYTGKDFIPEVNDSNGRAVSDAERDLRTRLTQTAVLGTLNRLLDEDAVVVGSSGSLPGCMQRMWRARGVNTYNMEYGYSAMGYEICGALGAKLAAGTDREVYSFVGDGSFIMLHSELVTAIQEGIKINVVLFDNAGYGCINNLQAGQGNDVRATEFRRNPQGAPKDARFSGNFLCVDYAAIASAYGAKGYTIRTIKELETAVAESKNCTVPVLFDIKVLPKTMTEGYDSWWRVGTAELSDKPAVQKARAELEAHLQKARRY